MTFVELPVVPIYWHFPRTIKGYRWTFGASSLNDHCTAGAPALLVHTHANTAVIALKCLFLYCVHIPCIHIF